MTVRVRAAGPLHHPTDGNLRGGRQLARFTVGDALLKASIPELLAPIGTGVTEAAPGSVHGMQMTVDDIDAAAAELRARGVDAGKIEDFPWGRFLFLADPDGNRWAIQEVPPRPAAG